MEEKIKYLMESQIGFMKVSCILFYCCCIRLLTEHNFIQSVRFREVESYFDAPLKALIRL
jgi:hypothetical protein